MTKWYGRVSVGVGKFLVPHWQHLDLFRIPFPVSRLRLENSQIVCVPPAWILNLLILLFVSLWLWKATCSGNSQFSLHLNTHLHNGKLYIPVLFTLHQFSLNFFPPFLLSVIQFDLFSVTSWGGGESNVDRTISESSSKRQRKDSWDDEYDKGKVPCWLL